MNGLALGLLLITLRDVNGVARQPMHVNSGKANALFFVTNDCPISNAYAHEIARICADYKTKGISCDLIYVDPAMTDAAARQHAQEYGHGDYPKIVDRKHELVKVTGVIATPEVAVINAAGKVVYRGRIDDSFAGLGQPRRPVKNADLRNALDEVAAGKVVTTPVTKALGCYIENIEVRSGGRN